MFGLNLHALPAVVAVAACAAILYLTRRRGRHVYTAAIYRAVVLVFAAHNVNELLLFIAANNHLSITLFVGLSYYGLSVFMVAVLTHLSVALGKEIQNRWHHRLLVAGIYAPAVLIQPPLWLTRWIIAGYQTTNGVMPGAAWNSVHGPGYSVLLGLLFAYMVASAIALVIGTRSPMGQRRRQSYVVLFASAPFFVFSAIAMLQLERLLPLNPFINVTDSTPFAVLLFLAGTGYAVYQYRLIDIEFYIPWSRKRFAKREFYRRIVSLSNRLAWLDDPEEATRHIADVLHCPLAIRMKDQTIATNSPISARMAEMPIELLAGYDRILIADEMEFSNERVADIMRQHQVFAAVPIPIGAGPDLIEAWVLLGERLSDTVYSSRDFYMLGRLFNRMEAVFFDRLGTVRAELKEISGQIERLNVTAQGIVERLRSLSRPQPQALIGGMHDDAVRLLRAEETTVESRVSRGAVQGVLYIGRDRALLQQLRRAFPQTRRVASPASPAFARLPPPAIVIYERSNVPAPAEAKLIAALATATHRVACYVFGRDAAAFVQNHAARFRDVAIHPLPADPTTDQIIAEVRRDYGSEVNPAPGDSGLGELVRNFEKKVIEMALTYAGGNQTLAARLLEMPSVTLHRKIVRHGIATVSSGVATISSHPDFAGEPSRVGSQP